MKLETELGAELQQLGAEFFRFVDISALPSHDRLGFPTAILVGTVLSPGYVATVAAAPDYVREMVRRDEVASDEFSLRELGTDKIADDLAEFLIGKGFGAVSQSERSLSATGRFNEASRTSVLPHKTVALMAGLGWIGKHNLLVTQGYGSAVSMCTVLTDAPLPTVCHQPPAPLCGRCTVCVGVCQPGALSGVGWSRGSARDERLDVSRCTTCLQCLVHCPWTAQYVKRQRD